MVYVIVFGLVACIVLVALPASRMVVYNTVAYLAFLSVPALRRMVHRLPFRQSEFDTIVSQIHHGRLLPDGTGVASLPPRGARLTQDGKVYVTRRRDGNMLVTFVTWRGRSFNFEGYLRSDEPLGDDALVKDSFINERGFLGYLEIQHPGSSYPASYAGAAEIDPTEVLSVTVEKKIAPHWYFVSYRLD
jgi:hypothetical protein